MDSGSSNFPRQGCLIECGEGVIGFPNSIVIADVHPASMRRKWKKTIASVSGVRFYGLK